MHILKVSEECPYINIHIGTHQFRPLLDTGAQLSLVSEEFLELCEQKFIKPTQNAVDVTLRSASGHTLEATRIVQIRITLGKVRTYHDFIVVKDLKHDMILGIDFLNARKAILDFDSQTMVIKNSVYPLKTKAGQEKSEINLVRIAEDVDVFPRSDVQIKCFMAKKKQAGADFVVTQLPNSPCFENEPGVLLPNAVVKLSKNKNIPWAIVNDTGRFIHFRKGQVLGIATKYTENDQKAEVSSISTKGKQIDDLSDVLSTFNLDHISTDRREPLAELLKKNIDLFVQQDADLTQTNVTEMRINTQNHSPTYQAPRRPPLALRPILEEQVQEMLNEKVIRRSNSPWLSPVLLVPKKDGGYRFCVDFRKLNAVTVRPAASIPSAEDIFYALGKSKFRTSLDMKQGFWQIPIREEDKEKTAFGTDAGIFEFNCTPYGLCGSPAVFQNCMNAVLGDIRHFALAFVDDIIVFSETYEDHLEHLQAVFDRLRKANLKLKISKCDFVKKQLNYLGHIISDDGISVDPGKVSVMENLQPPENIRDVRSFLGMTSYYRKYVPNFSKIARPLTALTRKNARFKWMDEAQTAFETLKAALLQAPILAFPDISKPFKLFTDASQYALGAVLMQEQDGADRVIQYVSHQFPDQKQKWPTIEREAFAIIYSLEKLRPILIGTDVTVYTDHKPLKHLFTSEMKNPRIQRWAVILSEYACKIEYISGPKNAAADMMSRLQNTSLAEDLNDNEHLDWKGEATDINLALESQIDVVDNAVDITDEDDQEQKQKPLDYHDINENSLKLAQQEDPEIQNIIRELKNETPDPQSTSSYCLENDLLYHVEKGTKTRPHTRMQIVVPPAFRKIVLENAHDGYLGGHLGIEKTTDKVSKSYFWSTLLKDVMQYVQSCETCQRRKLAKERRPMQDMPMPSAPMEILGIDTCGPFPVTKAGNKYVCTIVDHFSGWPEAYAIPDKSANTIAQILLDEFIPRHGCPRLIISDQGTEYCNALLDTVHKELNIARIHTSSYHPQSNGKTERFHRCMNAMIQAQISEDQTRWDEILQPCLGAYRMSKNESTKHTPFFVIHGRDPVLPVDTLLQPRHRYNGEDYVPAMFEHLHNAYAQVTQNTQQSREHNKTLIANKSVPSNFQPGDLVFYFDPSVQPGDSTKLTLYWKNYFRVVSKLGKENYCIKNMHTGKTKIVHSENLRHRDANDVWDRTYTSIRQPVQVSKMPEEQPTRQQPLRGVRLPYSDRAWYEDVTQQVPTPSPAPALYYGLPFIHAPETQVPSAPVAETQEQSNDEQRTEVTDAQSPLQPSTASASPGVFSPSLSENGEHGTLTPLTQRNATKEQPRYALRSQGPVTDPVDAPLEGYRYKPSQPRYVPKRQRDTSLERNDGDKRPRIHEDMDCLSIETTDPDAIPPRQASDKAVKAKKGLSATLHSMGSKVSSFWAKTKRRFNRVAN